MAETLENRLVEKSFVNAWQRYTFTKNIGLIDKSAYYKAQVDLLLEDFVQFLGDDEHISQLKTTAEGRADGDLSFYKGDEETGE